MIRPPELRVHLVTIAARDLGLIDDIRKEAFPIDVGILCSLGGQGPLQEAVLS